MCNAIPFVQLSVVMPVYNAEKYLSEAIESILQQSFEDFEFLIINDGSTDRSKDIVLQYDDPRIIYVENDSNMGLIATLNRGIKLARGLFLARMDADDISVKDRFAKQIAFLKNNPNYGLCGSTVRIIDGKGQRKKRVMLPITDTEIRTYSYFSSPLIHPTVMGYTHLFKSNLYSDDYKTAEDYELWVRLFECTCLYNLEDDLLFYRVHDFNVSKTDKDSGLDSSVRLLRRHLKCVLDEDIIDDFIAFVLMDAKELDADSFFHKMLYEKIMEDKYFYYYFIKRWVGICIRNKSYLKIIDNVIFRKMPVKYFLMLLRLILMTRTIV